MKESLVTRRQGHQAIAAAAYIARDRAYNEHTGRTVDFTPEAQFASIEAAKALGGEARRDGIILLDVELKDDLVYNAVVAPIGSPEWANRWDSLWNHAELYEDSWATKYYARTPRRAEHHILNATIAVKGNILLPREFSVEDAIEASREYAIRRFGFLDMAAQIAVHFRDGQPHVHYQVPLRRLTEKGFGVYAQWSNSSFERKDGSYESAITYLLPRARSAWQHENRQIAAEVINGQAAEQGHEVRVEPRSFRDLDVEFLRELPVGPGLSGSRVEQNQVRAEANAEIAMSRPAEIVKELFANTGVVVEAVLKRGVQRRCPDDISFQTTWRALFEEGHVIEVGVDPLGRRVYSSPDFIEQERSLLESAAKLTGRNSGTKDLERKRLETVISEYEAAKGFKLKDEQRRAVEHALFGGDLTAVQGQPGTGKTTAMQVAQLYMTSLRQELGSNGALDLPRIRGAAIAAVAAENLERESGIPSVTVAKIVHDYKQAAEALQTLSNPKASDRDRRFAEYKLEEARKSELKAGDLLIVDEAGMVPTADLALLQSKAASVGARVSYVGDHEQLSAVGAGGGFRLLVEKFGAVTLQEITRQKDHGDLEASKAFVRGDVAAGVMHYFGKGQLHFEDTAQAGIEKMVARCIELRDLHGGSEVLATANLNRDIDALNAAIRLLRKGRGELGEEHRLFGVDLAVGDEIMYLENNKRIGRADFEVDANASAADMAAGVKNGERAIVRGFALDEYKMPISVTLEKLGLDGAPNGQPMTFSVQDPLRVRHAYAITTHKAQGQTRDYSLHYAGNESRSLSLVSATRHRYGYEIFGDRQTYRDDIRDLIHEMSGDGRQENVVDFNVTPERRAAFEAVTRYAETTASYNVAVVRAPNDKATIEKLLEERRTLAKAIVGTREMSVEERERIWVEHRQFAAQARLTQWSLEEMAQVRDRLQSLRDRRARATVENFARLHQEAQTLWSEIAKLPAKQRQSHPDYPRFAALVLIRGREATIMGVDRRLYGPLVEEAGISWASVRTFATRHRNMEKERKRAEGIDKEAIKQFAGVVSEISKLSKARNAADRERLEALRAEARGLALDLHDAGVDRKDLPSEAKQARTMFESVSRAAEVADTARPITQEQDLSAGLAMVQPAEVEHRGLQTPDIRGLVYFKNLSERVSDWEGNIPADDSRRQDLRAAAIRELGYYIGPSHVYGALLSKALRGENILGDLEIAFGDLDEQFSKIPNGRVLSRDLQNMAVTASAGEQRKVEIARTLEAVSQAKVDVPTPAIDPNDVADEQKRKVLAALSYGSNQTAAALVAQGFGRDADVSVSRADTGRGPSNSAPVIEPVQATAAELAPQPVMAAVSEKTTNTQIDVEAIFARLPERARDRLLGGVDPVKPSTTQIKVLGALAEAGLTLEEATAVAEAKGGEWKNAQHYNRGNVSFREDMERLWKKYDLETTYRTHREAFHNVAAADVMADAVYGHVPSDAYARIEDAWRDNEEAIQAISQRAGVELRKEPVPEQPAERIVARGQEAIEAVRGEEIRVPKDPHWIDPAIVDAVRQAEDRRANDILSKGRAQATTVVLPINDWAAMLVNDRNAREKIAPRPELSDLPEDLRAVHQKALAASRLTYNDYAFHAGISKFFRSGIDAVFGGHGKVHKQELSSMDLIKWGLRQEMKRYETVLWKAGVSDDARKILLAREVQQRAAEHGLDFSVAMKAISIGHYRAVKSALKQETRLEKLVSKIEIERAKSAGKIHSRETEKLTPEESKAHEKALAAVKSAGIDGVDLARALETGRAYDQAMPKGEHKDILAWAEAALQNMRSKVALTAVEVRMLIHAEEMRIYKNSLLSSGIQSEAADRLINAEAVYRGKLLGVATDRALNDSLDTAYGAASHNAHRDRLDTIGATITAGRESASVRVANFDLSDPERQAHQAAVSGSRLSEQEIIGAIRNSEIAAVREAIGDKEGREFFTAWDQNATSLDDARKLILDIEVARYGDILRQSGVEPVRIEEMVRREVIERSAEIGIEVEPDRSATRDDVPAFGRDESSEERYFRFERLAKEALTTEAGGDAFDRVSRLKPEAIKKIAAEIEFAARESYAKENGVTLAEAARVVFVRPNELRETVRNIETEIAVNYRAENERETKQAVEKLAFDRRQEIIERKPSDVWMDRIDQFAELAKVRGEINVMLHPDQMRSLDNTAKALVANLRDGASDAYLVGRFDLDQEIARRGAEAQKLFERVEKEATAERSKSQEQDQSKAIGL